MTNPNRQRHHRAEVEDPTAAPHPAIPTIPSIQTGSHLADLLTRRGLIPQDLDRRDFLKLLAAPLALAGLSACVPRTSEKIVPYVKAPEEIIPGKPLFYATALELDGYACGVLVETQMGRPIKVEGNPAHPISLGATDKFSQAATLELYDPNRPQVIINHGRIRTWEQAQEAISDALEKQSQSQGAGIRILTPKITSPTLASQLNAILERFPQARWHSYEPVSRDNSLAGANLAFGQPVEPFYQIASADIILSLDSDFLSSEPASLLYSREFSLRRNVVEQSTGMNRLYIVESSFSTTGAVADHRLPLRASHIEGFTRLLAARLGVAVPEPASIPGVPSQWVDALVEEFQTNPGKSLIVAGVQQPPAVHALAHAMNAALGNAGKTVFYLPALAANPVEQISSLRQLSQDLESGQVHLLMIIDGDPAYNAPVDFAFADRMGKAELSIYLGPRQNTTSRLAAWHVPTLHPFEAWGDTRAFDGTATIQQPLIEPLYGGHSVLEVLSKFSGQPENSGREIVQKFWQGIFPEEDFNRSWQEALRTGIVPNTAQPSVNVTLLPDLSTRMGVASHPPENQDALELVFLPDPSIWDGRYFDNVWLQELPKPLTTLTWDNAALLSPATAGHYNLSTGDLITLTFKGNQVQAAVYILSGLPENSVTLHLGYGQQANQSFSEGGGFNAYQLRTSDAMWFGLGLEIQKTGDKYRLAATQGHHQMEGRDLVHAASLAEFQANNYLFTEKELHTGEPAKGDVDTGPGSTGREIPSMYPQWPYTTHAWGMTINLSACTGCNACMIACQAENNIPIVGKEQVANGREMHWIRVDSYFQGEPANPSISFQPVTCMHCENAPCEPVCPVEATVHDAEGLNEMVYNRCVGTRYCSNNCPYKVRRFNFLDYIDEGAIPLNMLRNPDVTVRERGVMEKCTYCVQRINAARIDSEISGQPIMDGEIVPACAQACPTQAIFFGDINDPNSQVHRLKQHPLNYGLLSELNTQPRTTYLAKINNPNPKLVG